MQGTPAAASDNSQGRGKVVVRELAGGCMCCSLSGPLGAAIAQLVRNAKPDRLIIEPSGLGHPAGLLDVLKVRQKRLGRAPVVAVTVVGVTAHRAEVEHGGESLDCGTLLTSPLYHTRTAAGRAPEECTGGAGCHLPGGLQAGGGL